MKKLLSMLLCAAMMISMTACSKEQSSSSTIQESLEIFSKVWETYSDEEKFPATGGDFENGVMNGPGKFDLSETEGLEAILLIPEECIAEIDDVASLMHMMNANTFTGAAMHITDAKNLEKITQTMKDKILNTHWMCGFPDVLIMVQVEDNYLVSVFGKTDPVETFKNKLLNTFSDSKILVEENLNS